MEETVEREQMGVWEACGDLRDAAGRPGRLPGTTPKLK